MSKDWFADVMEFHKGTGVLIGSLPALPDLATQRLRRTIEEEEYKELLDAEARNDLPELADAIVDEIYVLIGRAVSYGIDLRPIWDEVQRANMAKVGGPVRADGKRLKPPGWRPPDVVGILARQKSLS